MRRLFYTGAEYMNTVSGGSQGQKENAWPL